MYLVFLVLTLTRSIIHRITETYWKECSIYYYFIHNCFADFVATNITTQITIPTQSDPVPVKSVFGWIIIHQHLGDTFDWQLPWADYKAGFGSIDADFWLGLEKVHLLTSSQPYRLRLELQQNGTNRWFSAEYWSFKIALPESTMVEPCLDHGCLSTVRFTMVKQYDQPWLTMLTMGPWLTMVDHMVEPYQKDVLGV